MLDLRTDFVGLETNWTTSVGRKGPRTYLDSAATTLAMRSALARREQLLQFYGSPHTALNDASSLCVAALRWAQETVLAFFGFPAASYHCIFVGAGATAALNRAAAILSRLSGEHPGVVLSMMEHHSNDLPHRRAAAAVCHLPLSPDGAVDLEALEKALVQQRVGYVALTACSNVTGMLTPIGEVAALVHRHGAHLLVDGAQLAVHRRLDAPTDIDAFVFCGHKAYAPGTPGVLIVRKELHDASGPVEFGGGMVNRVSQHGFELATDRAQRTHAGTPDVLGAFQIAMVLSRLSAHGFDSLIAHEQDLTHRLMARLQTLSDQLIVYGNPDPGRRAGVVSFNLRTLDHAVVAWSLSQCFNITVRHGCFCAQPYVRELLGVGQTLGHSDDGAKQPGMVRASIGAYTTVHDIEWLLEALADIVSRPDHYGRWYRASQTEQCCERDSLGIARQLEAICRLV